MSTPLTVSYTAYMVTGRVPFRYHVLLYVEDLPTGVQTTVWGKSRAERVMKYMVNHGNELINEYGTAADLAAVLYARKREKEMANVKVGDRVKLLVDIGPYKKGRVCKVIDVYEDTFYEARGGSEWVDDRFPITVMPVWVNGDDVAPSPKDGIVLARGEFGPLDDAEDDE